MPCITGRSQHVLCDPGCADANKCCRQTNSFSFQRYCFCEESNKNPNNQQVRVSDVRYMICDAIVSSGVLDTFDDTTTFEDAATAICDETLPSFECPVTINIQPAGNGDMVQLATVFRGECSNITTNSDAIGTGESALLIDTFQCATFTITAP